MDHIRKLLATYAYNILGSYEEAKDVVQDAYLKFSQTSHEAIENKKAYLIRTVINLSINQKKRQKKLVQHYPGQWLPEPIATEKADTVINRKEILSYSLMILLEKLNAKQRAVFILKEAFDYDHKEIAAVLNITEEYSRKIFSRAKQQLKEAATADSTIIPKDYLDKYIDVIYKADTQQLENLLQKDITIISDGGGKVTAAINPVSGRKAVMKFLLGVYKKFYDRKDIHIKKSNINHQPAILYYKDNKPVNCQVFDLEIGHISRIWFIRNPDKLQSL
ncbi:MAG: sigma-70 family RNA polymerase sigma factor [Bacteroidota bacterium]|nr:sigma-70 family RNA polymerase sigma factor [Bacteroidota bacterium]